MGLQTGNQQPKLITIADFCRDFSCSRTEFYRQVAAGKIKLLKMGRMSRIRIEDAQSWAASLMEKAVA